MSSLWEITFSKQYARFQPCEAIRRVCTAQHHSARSVEGISGLRLPANPYPTRHQHVACYALKSAETSVRPGKCWLVGAGPGPAEYLTLKAVRLLESAEVIVYDDLGSQEALQLANPAAERAYVGKRGGRESIKQAEIDALLVQHCTAGRSVVRLKGGCPSVFSRVASEIAALSAAGVEYEMVPGISSALAAPLFAGFPLTHAQLGPSFTVLSAHDVESINWPALAGLPTLVLLMGGRNLGGVVARLGSTGWAADTPVAVIRSAGLPEQRVWRSTLGSVVADTAGEGPLSPCVVVVGKVAAL